MIKVNGKKVVEKDDIELNIKKLDLKDIYTFIKNNQKITKDEAINIVETILIKANKENIKLNQKELDIFFKSIKLLELNSKPTTVLTYLLLSILEKEAK
jgi:DNA polymerase-3 subunit delta'